MRGLKGVFDVFHFDTSSAQLGESPLDRRATSCAARLGVGHKATTSNDQGVYAGGVLQPGHLAREERQHGFVGNTFFCLKQSRLRC